MARKAYWENASKSLSVIKENEWQFLSLTPKNAYRIFRLLTESQRFWTLVTLARSGTLNSKHYFLVLKYISFIKNLFLSNYISAWYYRGICFYTIITKRGLCSLLTSSQCPNVWITLPMDRAIKCILPHNKEGVWSISCK